MCIFASRAEKYIASKRVRPPSLLVSLRHRLAVTDVPEFSVTRNSGGAAPPDCAVVESARESLFETEQLFD
jgi:hypothetical protein